MISTGFVLIIWFKMFPNAGLPQPIPKTFKTMQACQTAAIKLKDHYNQLYDPQHQYSDGNLVDVYCL